MTPVLSVLTWLTSPRSAGLSFAEISPATRARLAALLDPGLIPANPLDVWGTGADTRDLFGGSLLALAEDPAVEAVALAVDLVYELDGDDSYPLALLDVAAQTPKPLAVLSNLPSVIDTGLASQLRAQRDPGAGGHQVRPAGHEASAGPRPAAGCPRGRARPRAGRPARVVRGRAAEADQRGRG